MVMSCPQCEAKHPYRVQELRKVQAPNIHYMTAGQGTVLRAEIPCAS